jgi:hypothetical protein
VRNLTGSIGPNASRTSNAAGVEVILGVNGLIRKAIERYKKVSFPLLIDLMSRTTMKWAWAEDKLPILVEAWECKEDIPQIKVHLPGLLIRILKPSRTRQGLTGSTQLNSIPDRGPGGGEINPSLTKISEGRKEGCIPTWKGRILPLFNTATCLLVADWNGIGQKFWIQGIFCTMAICWPGEGRSPQVLVVS